MLRLFWRPQLYFDPDAPANGGIMLKFLPPRTATQKQRTVLFKCHGLRPVIRKLTQKCTACARERGQVGIRDTLPHHRGIAAGRMKTGNAFLLEQEHTARATAGQVISGRGASKTCADNDVIVMFHNVRILSLLYELGEKF